ncbi:MAG: hypothetical protein H0U76_06300 [Ktedonobacteraceae bacterium]|nr:hypothetical protein [Ktedonobacteraceae bacterium]
MVDLYEVISGIVDGVNYRHLGRNLANRYFDQALFPVGYDFDSALQLYNAHCADEHVSPIDNYSAMSDEQHALWGGFADQIVEMLAPWQGPEYDLDAQGWMYLQREATPAWLAVHPGYIYQDELDRRNRHYGEAQAKAQRERDAVMMLFGQVRQLNKLAFKMWICKNTWKRDLRAKQMRELFRGAQRLAEETPYVVHKVYVEPKMRSGKVGIENLVMDENHVAFQIFGYDSKYEALRP